MPLGQGSYSRDFGQSTKDERDTCIPRFFMDVDVREIDGMKHYQDVEMVEIIMPGNLNKPVQIVRPDHKGRWPAQYAAFKAGQEMPVNGTPLEEWPVLSRAQALTLKSFEMRTVEDVAGMNEYAIQRVGMGARQLQQKALVYLDKAKSDAVANRAIELENRLTQSNTEKDSQIARLNEQIGILGEQMRQMSLNQATNQANISSAPSAVAIAAIRAEQEQPKVVQLSGMFSKFAAEPLPDVQDRNAGVKAEIAAWGEKGPVAASQPHAETVSIGLQGDGVPKKRGRKSNAQKAAEAAARGE